LRFFSAELAQIAETDQEMRVFNLRLKPNEAEILFLLLAPDWLKQDRAAAKMVAPTIKS
jgi:hypothetical protein